MERKGTPCKFPPVDESNRETRMPSHSRPRSSRDEILILLRAGPHTAAELAEIIEISPQAVRDQLRTLEGKGWIAVERLRRDTGGKPAREYVLTADGEESFEKPYPEILRYLLGELQDRLGGRQKRELFEAVGRRLGADLRENGVPDVGPPDEPGPGQLRKRLEAAVETLNALGGAAEVAETREGLRIQSHGCPLSELVRQDPEACLLAEALVQTVSGVDVTETCDRDGRPRCRFEVSTDSVRARDA